ncbi:MAG TPA: hypothetical protein VGN64_02420, partial [Dyadobacter sp.]|nr:hypothetical protein [Dyadobacter sp.]
MEIIVRLLVDIEVTNGEQLCSLFVCRSFSLKHNRTLYHPLPFCRERDGQPHWEAAFDLIIQFLP